MAVHICDYLKSRNVPQAGLYKKLDDIKIQFPSNSDAIRHIFNSDGMSFDEWWSCVCDILPEHIWQKVIINAIANGEYTSSVLVGNDWVLNDFSLDRDYISRLVDLEHNMVSNGENHLMFGVVTTVATMIHGIRFTIPQIIPAYLSMVNPNDPVRMKAGFDWEKYDFYAYFIDLLRKQVDKTLFELRIAEVLVCLDQMFDEHLRTLTCIQFHDVAEFVNPLAAANYGMSSSTYITVLDARFHRNLLEVLVEQGHDRQWMNASFIKRSAPR